MNLPQYKHDRFSKLYLQALYESKGIVQKDIAVMKDEDLKIDLIFDRASAIDCAIAISIAKLGKPKNSACWIH
jgi:hypothetical protein